MHYFVSASYSSAVNKSSNSDKSAIDIFKILKSKKVGSQAFLDLVENKKDLYSKYKITTENETLDKYVQEYNEKGDK